MGDGGARDQARVAAQQAEIQRQQLEQERRELKRQADLEKARAQRTLMRGVRAAGGGFFETTADLRDESDLGTAPSQPRRRRGFGRFIPTLG